MKRLLTGAAALTILFFALSAFAAPSSSVQITARAFPEKATVGDEIRLVLRVDRPRDYSLRAPSVETKLPPFELKAVETAAVARGKNRVGETFILTLTTFELGHLVVPSVSVTVIDDQGREKQVLSDPVAVEIVSVSKTPPEKAALKPIKGPVSMDLKILRTIFLGSLAAVLTITLAFKLFLRLKSRTAVDPESLKPAHERALLELGRLRKAGILSQGRIKDHYSNLADILRRYVGRRFGVEAADLTTAELLAALREASLGGEALVIAGEVLEASDLVKFAKLEPKLVETERTERCLEEFVASTKPLEEAEGTRK